MDPVSIASKATPMIEQHGTLGAVVLAACSVIVLLMAAIVVLWKGREAAMLQSREAARELQEAQKSHYKWAIDEIARKTEVERHLVESLTQLRETLNVVVAVTSGMRRDAQ